MEVSHRIAAAVAAIRSMVSLQPRIGLVLGSGLGDFCDTLQEVTEIPFSSLPDFPVATVEGHSGAFVFGTRNGTPVVALRGRVHYYEGYSQQEITIPTRVMALLGVKVLVLTNAAGGINKSFTPGTLMVLNDHINFSGANPLMGANLEEFGPRFPDMSEVYDAALRRSLMEKAQKAQIPVREGVYLMYSGPSYETPAEIRFFHTIGADATGMSTVPEAIVANHAGLRVMGISCITNMAAGILPQKLSHSEVVETADRVKVQFVQLLDAAIEAAQQSLSS